MYGELSRAEASSFPSVRRPLVPIRVHEPSRRLLSLRVLVRTRSTRQSPVSHRAGLLPTMQLAICFSIAWLTCSRRWRPPSQSLSQTSKTIRVFRAWYKTASNCRWMRSECKPRRSALPIKCDTVSWMLVSRCDRSPAPARRSKSPSAAVRIRQDLAISFAP
jgi:hypothetical protein